MLTIRSSRLIPMSVILVLLCTTSARSEEPALVYERQSPQVVDQRSDQETSPSPISGGSTASTLMWRTILFEDFEGDFPGTRWYLAPPISAYWWGKRDCKAYEGNYSAWGVGGGALGSSLVCGDNYPNDIRATMRYGPFDLSNCVAAELTFRHWTRTELGTGFIDSDYLAVLASYDNITFSGPFWSGDWTGTCDGWCQALYDLTEAGSRGNLCGRPEVWIRFVFTSNSSVTDVGVFVDNVEIRVGEYLGDHQLWLPLAMGE